MMNRLCPGLGRTLRAVVVAGAGALLCAAPAAAQLDYVLGPPRAAAGCTIDMATPTTVSSARDEFGPFVFALTREHSPESPYVRIAVDYRADLDEFRYAASGTVSAHWLPGQIPEVLPVFGQGGQASASLRAQFFVTEPIGYRMHLTSTETGVQGRIEDLSAHVTLIKGNGLAINTGLESVDTTLTGVLTPDFYVLQFTPMARAWERGELYGSVTFDFEFVLGSPPPPCPADFNASGAVDVADIFSYLAAWFAQSAGSDFDASGATDVADIFSFLAAWFAGCP